MIYRDLDEFLGDRDSCQWKYSNTWFERLNDDTIAVRLYHTNILIYESDGTLTLSAGNYYTVTTKKRINEIFDEEWWHVYAEKGTWYIWNYFTKKEFRFVNGMVLIPDEELIYQRATVVYP